MREKALLFSDYHQSYNFLYHEKEKPNTSLESVYGGSDVAPPKSSSSSSSKPETFQPRRSRPETGRRPMDDSVKPKPPVEQGSDSKRNSYPPSGKKIQENLSKKAPPPRLNAKQNLPNKTNGNIMPKNLTETGSTSMEWDPYYLNTKKNEEEKRRLERKHSNSKRRSRNISPISEEDTGEQEIDQPVESLVPNVGSDEGMSDAAPVSDSIYPLNTSDTSESPSIVPPPQRKVSPPQRSATFPGRKAPPQGTSPPARTSPPQRSSPSRRISPPQIISPPQRSLQLDTSPRLTTDHSSLPESGGSSPHSAGRNERSDKHTQIGGHRR